MADGSLANEGTIRFAVFLGVFVLMAIWEMIAARRELSVAKGPRWFANMGLVVVGHRSRAPTLPGRSDRYGHRRRRDRLRALPLVDPSLLAGCRAVHPDSGFRHLCPST